jgi:hypothetical protein
MIAHEAICPDLQAIFCAIGSEPIEVNDMICIRPENSLAVIAPLGNMVRETCSDNPGDSWYGAIIGQAGIISQEMGAVPNSYSLFLFFILILHSSDSYVPDLSPE